MQIDIGVALLLARCLMLVIIAVTIGSYRDPSARKRWAVSLMAVCAAGSSMAWAMFSLLMVFHRGGRPDALGELLPTLFVLCAMVPVLYTRGNVAKLLPRVKWLYR